MTADNEFVCYVNGRRVGKGNDFNRAYTMNVAAALKPGDESDRRGGHQHHRHPEPGRPDRPALDQAWRRPHDRGADRCVVGSRDESRPGLELQRETRQGLGRRPCSLGRSAWPRGARSRRRPRPRRSSRRRPPFISGWPRTGCRPTSTPTARCAISTAASARRTSTSWPTARRKSARRPARSASPASSRNCGIPRPAASRR